MRTLGQRIRIARRNKGLSQAELAKRASVTASAVAQWEHPSGTRPDLKRLQLIAKATGVTVEWLVTGEASKRITPAAGIEPQAVAFDLYAASEEEETLLVEFRQLPLKLRESLLDLMKELATHRGRKVRQQR